MNELKLIHSIFDQEVRFTINLLTSLKQKDWDLITDPWDSFLFNGLTKNVSVTDLIKHMVMLEHLIIDCIGSQEDGFDLPSEGNETLCMQQQHSQDLIACYTKVHEENSAKLRKLTPTDLDKKFTFIGRHYTGIGLLWMLTGHHAYHLGQLRSMDFSSID